MSQSREYQKLALNPTKGHTTEQVSIILQTMLLFVGDELPELGMDFNAFEWSKEKQLGLYLGMFVKNSLIPNSQTLQLLFEFASEISDNYLPNPYHSFYHAIDVAYMCYYLMEDMGMAQQLDFTPSEKVILLVAALGHDVLHPGTNNLFQRTETAIKYKNISVLENLSADFVGQLLYKYKFIKGMSLEIISSSDSFDIIVKRVKECILKTDMFFHFKMLDELLDISDYNNRATLICNSKSISPTKIASIQNRESPLAFSSLSSGSSASLIGPAQIIFQNTTTRQNMLGLILHAADISNPVRPYSICKKWSTLVMEEFHNQGLLEKEAGYPISPNMNSSISDQAQIQLTFTQVIVQPIFEVFLELFPRTLNLMDLIIHNVKLWGGMNTTNPDKQEQRKISDKYKKSSVSGIIQSPAGWSNDGSRRVSIAAGIIDIPESLQKYLSRSKVRNSIRVGANETRLSPKIHSSNLDFFHEAEEETESFSSGYLSKSPEKQSTMEESTEN